MLKSAVYPMSTESQAQEYERGMRAPRGIFITFGGPAIPWELAQKL